MSRFEQIGLPFGESFPVALKDLLIKQVGRLPLNRLTRSPVEPQEVTGIVVIADNKVFFSPGDPSPGFIFPPNE